MQSKSPAIDSAIEAVNLRNEPAIYVAPVNSANIFKTSLIIVISDAHIFIFNINGKVKQVLSFYEMIGMTIDGSTITFKFENTNYSIFTTESQKIFDCVYDIVSHIFTIKEQHKLTITNFRVEQHLNNGLSALFRLKAIYQNPHKENFKTMETILMCSQPCISVNQFVDQANFLPHLITVLPLCPYIKSIVFNKIDGIDNYEYLALLCQNEIYLQHIMVQGQATFKFNEFIGNLQSNRNAHLFALGFADSNLTAENLNLISSFIKVGGLRSIEFHNAIGSESMISFYNTFLTSGIFETIFMMNMSGTKNLNLTQFFPKITSIRMLCLSNCDLEIYDIFTNVSTLTDLKSLDISNNHCSSQIDPNDSISFPQYLQTLNLNNTDFSPECALPLLRFIFNHFENGLNLSIASLAPPESTEWKSILHFISHSTYRSLVSLTWDGNLIHPKLFTFLLKNPYLKNLSLNACVSLESATDAMASIALFIQSSKSLVNLSVRGDRTNFIGNNLETLFTYIPESETLETLDLTYSKCGDAGLNQITTFLTKCTSLKTLIIDGMRPKTVAPLFNLAKLAYGIRNQIKLSYPYNDIEKLVSERVLSRKGQNEIKHFFEIDEGNSSYFLRPFRVYRYFLFDEFPDFIEDDKIGQVLELHRLLEDVPPPLPQESEKKSQSVTRTEILDFDNYSSKRSKIKTRGFNYNASYALTPNAQTMNFWSRSPDFSKTLPSNAVSAPVSPAVGNSTFTDLYRKADIYDEPIRRVKTPHSTRESSQRSLRTTVNVFRDDEDNSRNNANRQKKSTPSSRRSRSTNSTPKKKQNETNISRRSNNNNNNDDDAEEQGRRTTVRKVKTPQSQRRVRRQEEEIENDEKDNLVRRSSSQRNTPSSRRVRRQEEEIEDDEKDNLVRRSSSQRNTPSSRRPKRPQNDIEEDQEPTKATPVKRRSAQPSSQRSKTPTGNVKRVKRKIQQDKFDSDGGDDDEDDVKAVRKVKTPTPKIRNSKSPTSSSRRSNTASTTPQSRKRQTRRNLTEGESDDDDQVQVQRETPKRTTKKRTQKRV